MYAARRLVLMYKVWFLMVEIRQGFNDCDDLIITTAKQPGKFKFFKLEHMADDAKSYININTGSLLTKPSSCSCIT
jgi:hypothetical protein